MPTFTEYALSLDAHFITISGYVTCLDDEESFFVLTESYKWRGNCCGMATVKPDQLMDILWQNLPVDPEQFSYNTPVQIFGRLELNDNDMTRMNYVLNEARLVSR